MTIIPYIDRTAPFPLDPAIRLLGKGSEGLALDFVHMRAYMRDRSKPEDAFLGDPNDLLIRAGAPVKYLAGKEGLFSTDTRLRTDHGADGSTLGLLIEEERTNLLLHTMDFTHSLWRKEGVSFSATAVPAPDGSLAFKMNERAGYGSSRVDQGGTVTAGTTYTLSVFARAGERSKLEMRTGTWGWPGRILVDLENGTLTPISAPDHCTISGPFAGWYRLSLTVTSSTTGNVTQFFVLHITDENGGISYQGDGASGLYLWGPQVEVGTNPSSHIPSQEVQGVRAADLLTIGATAFPLLEGGATIVAEFASMRPGIATQQQPAGIWGFSGAGMNATDLRYENSLKLVGRQDSAAPIQHDLGVLPPEGIFETVAIALDGQQSRASRNGEAVSVGSVPCDLSATTLLNIGSTAVHPAESGVLNGHLRSLVLIPRLLSDAELRARTSG
ncbi:hypothetical protein [Chelativorans sp. Marseille-P2723]|uniref:phage head spike fiber domain-containing protein n=1 Tax=Chelativorans sp. Marseille-P2723 TaxID=2709133 RepID=UPI00156DC7CE|nr:hypothetical protein [Chelativorans sp. Marseille-P2723]